MLETGIFAAVLVVAAVVVLLVLWTIWRCWFRCIHRIDNKLQPQAVYQHLVSDNKSEEVACQSFLSEEQSDEGPETLGLETGQTLKRRAWPKLQREDSIQRVKTSQASEAERCSLADAERPRGEHYRSSITLEIILGPAQGNCATSLSGQSITIGRVAPNKLIVNDPEVSGKHAHIKWNSQKSVWELVDLGSLNGTFLNNQAVSLESNGSASRKPGLPFELSNGDIVSLGSTSQVLVHISDSTGGPVTSVTSSPFEVGIAADPMALRRGGKRLAMEDVCFCEWPLRGVQQFGAFCIFDGHGGVAAAQAASKIMPEKLSAILKGDAKWAEVLNNVDATDVLRAAFDATEAALDHEYEGCTATVLLLWLDRSKVLYAQCANVGDSACIFSIEGKFVSMTEDHRLTSFSEKSRMLEMGKQLREGERRLCGMNIARVLGDKFLKQQDSRFSAQPFVSEVLRITKDSKALAVIASDGLWDVLSQRRVLQLAVEARDARLSVDGTKSQPSSAQGIADMLISKARTLRTKDNTSAIVLDFATSSKPIY